MVEVFIFSVIEFWFLSVSVCFSSGDGAAGGEGDQQCYRPAQPRGGHAESPGVHLHRHPAARSDSCDGDTFILKESLFFSRLVCHIQVNNAVKGFLINKKSKAETDYFQSCTSCSHQISFVKLSKYYIRETSYRFSKG